MNVIQIISLYLDWCFWCPVIGSLCHPTANRIRATTLANKTHTKTGIILWETKIMCHQGEWCHEIEKWKQRRKCDTDDW